MSSLSNNNSSNTTPFVWAVVPAAGVGSRMNSDVPKQYHQLLGKAVLQHTLERLLAVEYVEGVVIALNKQDEYWKNLSFSNQKVIQVVDGGDQRMHSVFSALQWLKQQNGFEGNVLVHDAARPCIQAADVTRLIEAVGENRDGGLLATPLADTLKRSDCHYVCETIPRDGLWQAQTPQYFPLLSLYEALQMAMNDSVLVTDEAQAMERLGAKPLLVPGRADNIKITQAEDITLAECYMEFQSNKAKV